MTQREKSQSIGLLVTVVFTAVLLWALVAVVWPIPVVYADEPEIITITVTSSLETYFYDPGLAPTGGTVYFNSVGGEGAGQVITVTMTVTGSTPITLTGAPAFGMTPMPDTTDTGELGITYTIGIGADTENGVLFTVTASDGFTATAVITFTQDITDPTIVSPTLNETSNFLHANGLTLYYSDLMGGIPQSFTVQGNAADNDNGADLYRATFSSAFGITPTVDYTPTYWSGVYDNVESTDSGNGTITVTVYDNVGNWSTGVFTYIEDTITPTVEFTDVTNPDHDFDSDELDDDGSNWYDPNHLSAGWYFTSTVTDTLSGLALANASWDHSNGITYDQFINDPDLDGDGVFNNVSDDGDGVVTVTLTITDNVGNSASDIVVFNLDNTEPTIISPYIHDYNSEYLHVVYSLTVYYGDDMESPQDFEVRGYAEDTGVGPYQATYPLVFDDPQLTDDITAFPHYWAGRYDVDENDCCNGTITVTVSDRVGNSATQIFTYTRDVFSPTVSYGSPPIVEASPYLSATGTTVYYSDQMGGSAQDFEVQGTASDDGAGFRWVTFTLAFGDTPGPDSSSPWSGRYDVINSNSGPGNITATASDNVGNWSTAVFTYIEDTTNPTVSLTYVTPGGYDVDNPDDWLDADGSNWYNAGDFIGNRWFFTSTTSDGGAGLASGTAFWDHSNGTTYDQTKNCGSDGSDFFSDIITNTNGTVTVTVTITDNVGNPASATVDFNIDNTAPMVTSPSISEDSDYLHRAADLITVYYGDDEAMDPVQVFTVNGSSNDTAVGLKRAEFSEAFGNIPTPDDEPSTWSRGYYPNSQDWGNGTITVTVYDQLDNAAYENFYYIRDTEPPVVFVNCPGLTSAPSWSVDWSGSWDPLPASGLNHFDVQYREESGDWQDWLMGTSLTEATFGPDSPIIVQDDATYYFRVRAEDNVSNEQQYTNCETMYSSGIKKVFLPILMAPDPNWGFETGDFTNWQHGGQLAQSVSTADRHSGSYAALLGSPGYACNNVPVGSAWLRRSVTVPSSSSPTLSFWYRIYTQDKNSALSDQYDLFAVYINGSQLVVKDANATQQEGCGTTHILLWKQVIFPLDAYKGQTIEITFYNYNRPDNWYNTYTYVDDVSVQ